MNHLNILSLIKGQPCVDSYGNIRIRHLYLFYIFIYNAQVAEQSFPAVADVLRSTTGVPAPVPKLTK